jgi:hypothetical protein
MGLLLLQEIFCQSYPAYDRTHRVPAHQRKAARAIMPCRTAALGEATCHRALTVTSAVSGPTPADIVRARNVPLSRANAGWPRSGRVCSRVTILTRCSPYRTISTPCGMRTWPR